MAAGLYAFRGVDMAHERAGPVTPLPFQQSKSRICHLLE